MPPEIDENAPNLHANSFKVKLPFEKKSPSACILVENRGVYKKNAPLLQQWDIVEKGRTKKGFENEVYKFDTHIISRFRPFVNT